jgi:membrane-bound lytic murein transglycosylase MltF
MKYWIQEVLFLAFFLAILILSTANAQAKDGRLERCEPHRGLVESILKSEGLSSDYYYLMVAESGCRPNAVSKAGAFGFWQLMPATARRFGCAFANDITCETRAAARYLKTLEARFDSFHKVIWAYNMGGHNLERRKTPTSEARGLVSTIERLRQEDKACVELSNNCTECKS